MWVRLPWVESQPISQTRQLMGGHEKLVRYVDRGGEGVRAGTHDTTTTRHDTARQDKTRQDKTRQDETRQDKTRDKTKGRGRERKRVGRKEK